MNADFIIIAALAFSTIVLLVSGTHVAFVTLALTSGYVLSEVVGEEIIATVNGIAGDGVGSVESIVRVALLVIPALLIAIRFRKSQRGVARVLQQALPAFTLAAVLLVFVYQNLPAQNQYSLVTGSDLASQVPAYGNWLVVFAIGAALFDVVLQHAGPKRKYKKRKGGKDD